MKRWIMAVLAALMLVGCLVLAGCGGRKKVDNGWSYYDRPDGQRIWVKHSCYDRADEQKLWFER